MPNLKSLALIIAEILTFKQRPFFKTTFIFWTRKNSSLIYHSQFLPWPKEPLITNLDYQPLNTATNQCKCVIHLISKHYRRIFLPLSIIWQCRCSTYACVQQRVKLRRHEDIPGFVNMETSAFVGNNLRAAHKLLPNFLWQSRCMTHISLAVCHNKLRASCANMASEGGRDFPKLQAAYWNFGGCFMS